MTVSISGTVYTDAGSTTMGSGRTLNVSVNGAASSGSTTTASDGTYTISGLTVAAADVLTVYLQGNTELGATVTRGTGSNMTGVDVYQNHLNLRSDDGTPLTGANLNASDANGATGISGVYAAATNTTLTTNNTNAAGICVMPGQTFAPGTGWAGTVNGGNWLNRGTFTSGSSTVTLARGGSGVKLTSGGSSFNNLTLSTPGTPTVTLQDALTVTGTLALLAGATLDVSASNYAVNCSPTLSGNANFTGTFTARGGTVTLGGSASRTMTTGGNSFYNLSQSNAGVTTVSGTLTATNALSISSGTVSLAGNNMTLTGAAFTNSGTLQLQGGETLTGFTNDVASGGTVTYVGTGTTTYTSLAAGSSYKHLTFNGSGRKWQPAADVTASGNVTITAGTLDMSANNKNLNIAGNWANAGTFTAGTGTVTLNGTNQTISGSTTFCNLTKTVAAADTLTFTDGTTQTVTNALTLQGASGQLLTLAGTSTGGWTLAVPATQTLDHLSVSHSTATGNTAAAGATSTDGGNNVNWTFGAAVRPWWQYATQQVIGGP